MSYYSNYSNDDSFVEGLPAFMLFCLLVIVCLTQCNAKNHSNRDNSDTEKIFNFFVDYNEEGTAVVKINGYSGYDGDTVEFITQDGLQVLTGLCHSELMRATSYEKAYQRALTLAGGNDKKVISYDLNQGLNVNVEDEYTWNKNNFNLNYDFDYAITETEYGVVVTNISTTNISKRRDLEDDDKVQFVDSDGIVHFTTFTSTSLLNSLYADEGCVYQYALSLAGSENRLFGDVDLSKHKAKRLVKKYIPEETNGSLPNSADEQ